MENQYFEDYFNKTEIEKRKSVMKKWMEEDKESAYLCKKVYDYRYQPHGKGDVKDYFLRGWVLLCGLKNGMKVKPNRHTNKMMSEIKDCFALKEYEAAPEDLREIFFKEYVNMTEFYIELSFQDRSYSSGFLGLMKMDHTRVLEKLAKEIYAISYTVPRRMNCFEEFKPVREAMEQGVRNKFEDHFSIFEKVVQGNETKN